MALNLVRFNRLVAPKTNCSSKFGNGDTSAPHQRTALLGFLESARKKNLSQEVAQRKVASSLQGQVDASLDKVVLPFQESQVKCVQLAPLDAVG